MVILFLCWVLIVGVAGALGVNQSFSVSAGEQQIKVNGDRMGILAENMIHLYNRVDGVWVRLDKPFYFYEIDPGVIVEFALTDDSIFILKCYDGDNCRINHFNWDDELWKLILVDNDDYLSGGGGRNISKSKIEARGNRVYVQCEDNGGTNCEYDDMQIWNVDLSRNQTFLGSDIAWVGRIDFSSDGKWMIAPGSSEIRVYGREDNGNWASVDELSVDVIAASVDNNRIVVVENNNNLKTYMFDGNLWVSNAILTFNLLTGPISPEVVLLGDTLYVLDHNGPKRLLVYDMATRWTLLERYNSMGGKSMSSFEKMEKHDGNLFLVDEGVVLLLSEESNEEDGDDGDGGPISEDESRVLASVMSGLAGFVGGFLIVHYASLYKNP